MKPQNLQDIIKNIKLPNFISKVNANGTYSNVNKTPLSKLSNSSTL